MAIFEWSERYETGIPGIDAQHHSIVDAVNELYAAIEENRGSAVLGPLLSQLQNYIDSHFADEASYMVDLDYPDRDRHVELHARFKAQLERHIEISKTEDPKWCVLSLAAHLREWLLDHILAEDKKLFDYVHRHSNRPPPGGVV